MEGAGPQAVRFSRWTTVALAVAFSAWTLFIVATPELRFLVGVARIRVAIEIVGATVAALTFATAYLHYSLSGSRSWFFVALAFVPIAFNRLVFGVLISPDRLGPERAFYFWSVGRLMLGVLLLIGGLRGHATSGEAPRHPLRRFLAATGVVIGVLAAIEGALWALGDALPPLAARAIDPSGTIGAVQGLSPTVIALGAAGTLLYVVVMVIYLRRPQRLGFAAIWLPPALMFAAFSHVHHTLFPTVFGDQVSTGDLLRLGFWGSLLLGVGWEVRRTYRADRDRRRELAAAFDRERTRVLELEELDRAKQELFGILTHELLHPVAALRGLSLLVLKRWGDLDDGTRREFVERMERQSAILRDLADYVRTAVFVEAEGFTVSPKPEDPAEIARTAAESAREFGGEVLVRVAPAAEGTLVVSDHPRAQQVFRNLLSNAFKYAGIREPVELTVESADGEVIFSVIDKGPGIDADDVPKLFQRFSRLETPDTAGIEGTGLGLYISRRVVEAHGGRIWVESRPGEGAAFRFTLPRVEAT